jgi:hypothetical protein
MTSPAQLGPAPASDPGETQAEAVAWASVLAAWEDDAAHAGYLSRFQDLEGLAVAGRRYRDAARARPGDAVAARWRDEVIRRATAQGFAQLPRSGAPAPARAAGLRRTLVAVAAALLVLAAFLLLAGTLGARS